MGSRFTAEGGGSLTLLGLHNRPECSPRRSQLEPGLIERGTFQLKRLHRRAVIALFPWNGSSLPELRGTVVPCASPQHFTTQESTPLLRRRCTSPRACGTVRCSGRSCSFLSQKNWFTVREALIQAGRQDLIRNGCDCLIPAQPPKEAIEARRRRANDPDHYHTVANPAKGEKTGERGLPNKGYRPGRKSARRQDARRKRKGGGQSPHP